MSEASTTDDPDRKFLTPEAAEAMLPDGDTVHTILNGTPGVLIGADWDRQNVLDLFRTYKPEIAGPMARGMNHGIAVMRGTDRLFVETKKQ
jgi:hypothetical protein